MVSRRPTHFVRPGQEAQAPVLQRRVLERIPEAHGARRLGVQERAVLVRRDGAAYLGLLADDHALQAPRVREAEAPRDLRGSRRPGAVAVAGEETGEGRAQRVQVVADLVDGELLWLGEVASGVEGVWGEGGLKSAWISCN